MKPILILLFIAQCAASQAQMCPCEFGKSDSGKRSGFELGLNLYNSQEVLINFFMPEGIFRVNALNGLMLKYHTERFSVRAGMDLATDQFEYEYNAGAMNWSRNEGKSNGYHIRLGLEKGQIGNKLQLYTAADLLYYADRFRGSSEGYGDIVQYYKTDYDFRVKAGGISPALGLRYRPGKRFSFSVESSVSILYYSTSSQDNTYEDDDGTALLLNPLRLFSASYHFGL